MTETAQSCVGYKPLWDGVEPLSSLSFTVTTPVSISIFSWARSPVYAATCAGNAKSDGKRSNEAGFSLKPRPNGCNMLHATLLDHVATPWTGLAITKATSCNVVAKRTQHVASVWPGLNKCGCGSFQDEAALLGSPWFPELSANFTWGLRGALKYDIRSCTEERFRYHILLCASIFMLDSNWITGAHPSHIQRYEIPSPPPKLRARN